MHTARGHALMRRLEDDRNTLRFKDIIDRIGDLSRHLFLDLQTLGVDLKHASELADANHATAWNISHPSLPDDGRHVMLTMALEANATQHNHFIITFDFLERFLQEFDWVQGVADKNPFERACHACWSLDQAFPFRIIASPSNNGSKRSFDICSVGPVNLST